MKPGGDSMKFLSKHRSILEYNLQVNNINGILQSLSINLVLPFANLYAKRLNATDNDIALISSYPAIFCIFAVFLGTYLFRRSTNKKNLTATFFGIGRCFFLVFMLIPFLPLWIQPGLFVFLFGMMNFPISIANMGWQSYIADLFPNEWRGRAFSKRNSLSTAAALIVTFITGILLYYIPHNDTERIQLYQIFFFIAFLLAGLEVYSLTLHRKDRRNKHIETITDFKGANMFKMIYANKNFLNFCLCVVIFHFSWQIGWPLFFSFEFDILHTNEFWTSIISTVSFICQGIGFIYWQKFSEKKSNTYAMFVAAFLMAFCPFLYLIATHIYQVVFFNLITATAYAGTFLMLMNNLYETAPDENRTVYIAFYTIITNITLIVAPLLGMQLKHFFNIYTALFIVGVLRIIAGFAFYLRYRKYKKLALIKD